MDFRLYGFKEPLKCCKCNQDMFLDDVDYDFKGKFDAYWLCAKCHISAFQKVRFGKSYSIEFIEPEGNV